MKGVQIIEGRKKITKWGSWIIERAVDGEEKGNELVNY